jgi:pyridoxal phosphate enzyme (YggS family)
MVVFDPLETARFDAARSAVQERIERACAATGRDPSSVTLVAVTKTVPAERVQAAVAAGQVVFGENRVQEAADKRPLIDGGTWHLLGPLQGNKVRRAVETFDAVESLDSVDLAVRLDRIVREVRDLPTDGPVADDRRLPVLLQVNVDADPGKAGFTPTELRDALPVLLALGALRFDGCMTIGRLVDDPEAARPTFRALRELSAALRSAEPHLGPELSMGMSDDYAIAVEEGATIVRVGRALFGDRRA